MIKVLKKVLVTQKQDLPVDKHWSKPTIHPVCFLNVRTDLGLDKKKLEVSSLHPLTSVATASSHFINLRKEIAQGS
jgi:hypothetical protein